MDKLNEEKTEKNHFYQKKILIDLLRQVSDFNIFAGGEDCFEALFISLIKETLNDYFEIKKTVKTHPYISLSKKKIKIKTKGFYDRSVDTAYVLIISETDKFKFKDPLLIHPEIDSHKNPYYLYLHCINFPLLYSCISTKDIFNPDKIFSTSTLNEDINLWINADEDNILEKKTINQMRKLKDNVILKKEVK